HVRVLSIAAHELVLDVPPMTVRTKRGRIVDGDQLSVGVDTVREVALAFLHRGDRQRRLVRAARLPVALVVEVEVALPLVAAEARNLRRTADVHAVVVALEGRGASYEAPLLGLERVVAVELECGAVEGASAGLGDRHDLAGGGGAVFR